MATPVAVVAGVLERGGRILICQRKAGARHPLKWEFPGGKVEPGEEPRHALARELEEELGIRAAIGPEILRYEFHYPDRDPVLLIFYRIAAFSPEPLNLDFQRIEWAPLERLREYDFLEGDAEFLRRLACGDV